MSYTRSFITAHESEVWDLRATSDGLLGGSPHILQDIIEISIHVCFSWSLFFIKPLGFSHGGSALIGASNSKTPARLDSSPTITLGIISIHKPLGRLHYTVLNHSTLILVPKAPVHLAEQIRSVDAFEA